MKRLKYIVMLATSVVMAISMAACGEKNPVDKPDNGGEEDNKLVLPDGTIVLNSCAGGIYFGDFWDEGIGDYYFLLTNDTKIGQNEQGFDVPCTPGRWLVSIDIWGALSEDHTNPIVPEGTYNLADHRGPNVLTKEFTVATHNVEQVGEQFRILDHVMQEGTLVVKHTEKGYKVDAQFTTTFGEELKFTFEGAITLDDKSDDEPYEPGIKGDVVIEPVMATCYTFREYDNCDNIVLMLFDTTNLTYDNVHVAEPGMKLHLSIFTEPGVGLSGRFVPGTLSESGILTKEPNVFYPGRFYTATIALGSFLERINDDEQMSVEMAALQDGWLEITPNEDGTHTIVGEFITQSDGIVSCNWTGVVQPHRY